MTPPPDLLEAARNLMRLLGVGEGACPTTGGLTMPLHHVGGWAFAGKSCPACDLRRAIAHEEGLRRNAQIRTGPLLQTIRARDAAGTLRLGYRPELEPEQEDEGEE